MNRRWKQSVLAEGGDTTRWHKRNNDEQKSSQISDELKLEEHTYTRWWLWAVSRDAHTFDLFCRFHFEWRRPHHNERVKFLTSWLKFSLRIITWFGFVVGPHRKASHRSRRHYFATRLLCDACACVFSHHFGLHCVLLWMTADPHFGGILCASCSFRFRLHLFGCWRRTHIYSTAAQQSTLLF